MIGRQNSNKYLVLEISDVGVRRSEVEKCKEARILPQIKAMAGRDPSGNPVPSLGRSLHPEKGDLGLFSGASGAVLETQAFHLIEIRRVPPPAHVEWGLWLVVRTGRENERRDLAPKRRGGERKAGYELEVSRAGSCDVAEIEEWAIGTIRRPQLEDGSGRGLADQYSLPFGRAVSNSIKRRDIGRFNEINSRVWSKTKLRRRELREGRDEHVMCSCGHGSFGGGAGWRPNVEGVWPEPPMDGIQSIVDRDVRHSQDPRFMEWIDAPRRIVQPGSEARASGSRVPVTHGVRPGSHRPTHQEKQK